MSREKKVLIVEDDQDVSAGLGIRLGTEFRVIFAQDGVTAIKQAMSGRPDVIVLDLGLPAGDGFKVLQWLRENVELAEIPTIVLTGRDDSSAANKAADLGAAAFMRKPAEHEELLACVRKLANRSRAKRRRVLVVEDDADVREGLVTRLRASHFEVISAQDGASAVAAANSQVPDLILLDLGLPAGDGYSVLERVRQMEQLAATPVIVLSGRDPKEHRRRALASGAAMFLEKPTTHPQLLDAIEAVL